jgi:hypothetical protein
MASSRLPDAYCQGEPDVPARVPGVQLEHLLLLPDGGVEIAGVHGEESEVVSLRHLLRGDLDGPPPRLDRLLEIALQLVGHRQVGMAGIVPGVLLQQRDEVLDGLVDVVLVQVVHASAAILLPVAHPIDVGHGLFEVPLRFGAPSPVLLDHRQP